MGHKALDTEPDLGPATSCISREIVIFILSLLSVSSVVFGKSQNQAQIPGNGGILGLYVLNQAIGSVLF